jgi:hypothetical protein
MSRSITIGPAYGRDYPSKAKALADWDANKDFTIHDMFFGGSYVNKQQVADLKRNGVTLIILRYHKMSKIITIKL